MNIVKSSVLAVLPASWEARLRYVYNLALHRLEPEMIAAPGLARHRRRALDIGANVGLFTLHFSRFFAHVDTFEPIPQCAAVVQRAHLANVTVHQLAASSSEGTAKLFIPRIGDNLAPALASLSNMGSSGELLLVRTATVDSFQFDDVDLIKIDVEGHERQVLEGAKGTIARCRPLLIVEIEQRHHGDQDIGEVVAYIEGLGYEGHFLRYGAMHSIRDFDVREHQNPKMLLSRKQYTNNFIFLPNAPFN